MIKLSLAAAGAAALLSGVALAAPASGAVLPPRPPVVGIPVSVTLPCPWHPVSTPIGIEHPQGSAVTPLPVTFSCVLTGPIHVHPLAH